jgi:acyl dehydratase
VEQVSGLQDFPLQFSSVTRTPPQQFLKRKTKETDSMSESNDTDARAFRERLDALVGTPLSSGGPAVAPDPVNQPMIRHWVAALEDHNPVYTDPAFAAASRFGGIVAPPLMLQTWTMATPKITGIAERGGSPVELEGDSPLSVLDAAGFVGILATNSEFEFERYLRLGDVITATAVLESISEEKQTRMGRGHFVTWVTTYRDQQGGVVGRQRFRVLKFRIEWGAQS